MAASAMLTREGHTEDALAATFELDVRLAGAERLAAAERIVPIPVTPTGERPLWLGELVAHQA